MTNVVGLNEPVSWLHNKHSRQNNCTCVSSPVSISPITLSMIRVL